jgi:hypothetical protein
VSRSWSKSICSLNFPTNATPVKHCKFLYCNLKDHWIQQAYCNCIRHFFLHGCQSNLSQCTQVPWALQTLYLHWHFDEVESAKCYPQQLKWFTTTVSCMWLSNWNNHTHLRCFLFYFHLPHQSQHFCWYTGEWNTSKYYVHYSVQCIDPTYLSF